MNNQEVSTAYVGSTEIKEARLGTQLVLAPGGDALWYKANEIPTLDLRFADNKSLVDATTGQNLVTFSRGTVGTYVDSQGVLRTALVDEPRFDHDPTTGESLGLLVEEIRTNLLTYSENLSAWAGAGIKNLDAAVTDPTGNTGTVYYPTVSEASLTFNANGASQIAVSCFAKERPGNPGGDPAIQIFQSVTGTIVNLGTIFLPFTGTFAPTGNFSNGIRTEYPNGWYHFAFIVTADAGQGTGAFTTAGRIDIEGANSTDYVWGLQVEIGSFPTSYIKNVGTPGGVTRAADVASISGSNFSSWYNQSQGTVFAGSRLARQASVAGTGILGIETGVTNAEAIYMHYRSSGLTAAQVFDNSVSQADFSPYGSAVPANTTISQAIAFRANNTNASGGGGIGTTDTTCSMPTPDRLLIGYNSAAGVYLSGHISRLTFWPQRLSNATLQTITL